ncbi:hypothetical protein ABIC78_003188 [Novosphingobium sp. 1529]|uniref:DUF3237 family protein n=2 Tax=unclassified Novosphingobium TaxID=2644732 RepID=UPI00145BC976
MMTLSRRNALGAIGAGLPLAAAATRALAAPVVPPAPLPVPAGAAGHEPSAPPLPPGGAPPIYDKVGMEWVMDILPFCSQPEYMGSAQDQVASDGYRNDVWPIIGGVFQGRGIKGTVIPGGGDFPVVRPDGVVVVDALYRLKTDDGQQIIIHNKGLGYTEQKYRLLPTFEVPGAKYAWLRESVFVATLTFPIPPSIKAPDFGPNANGRLIQVFRMT